MRNENSRDIAVVKDGSELSVTEVKAQIGKIQELMHGLMQDGTHYGPSFPGDTKKNLLKPGADKLCLMFRLRPQFAQDIKKNEAGHMEVLTRCELFHMGSGTKVAEGAGMATTMESKHRWRNANLRCPECGKETIIKGKEEYGGGLICYAKKGGCGAKYADDDARLASQPRGKVENENIADCYNTVIKISKKRAYVDAVITACAASDIFTQDAEDFAETSPAAPREAKETGGNSGQKRAPAKTGGAREAMSESVCRHKAVELGNLLKTVHAGQPLYQEKEIEKMREQVRQMQRDCPSDEKRLPMLDRLIRTVKEDVKMRIAVLDEAAGAARASANTPAFYGEPEGEAPEFIEDIPEMADARQVKQEEDEIF
jgi:hypothetical protein